jgi:hypothetical protein
MTCTLIAIVRTYIIVWITGATAGFVVGAGFIRLAVVLLRIMAC